MLNDFSCDAVRVASETDVVADTNVMAFTVPPGVCKVGDVGKNVIVSSKWSTASSSVISTYIPQMECDALVTPSKLRYLKYQDDGAFLPFVFETNMFAEDSKPKWVDEDRDDVSAIEGLIAISVSRCSVECLSLSTSVSSMTLAPLLAGHFVVYPPALGVIAVHGALLPA